ncbi:hypothetical protein HELRODRAFT_82402, partial [Helobdella robusta]|uniref:Syndetin C-terminal domain-containing protein n=1 Tax=Helobdella robusta TaxID=6412 RepID=T1G4R8_HELRO
VSRKISELVLENHPSYVSELERVMELQRSLQDAIQTCMTSRRLANICYLLLIAKKNFTTTSLNLLANYKRRQQLLILLKSLHAIKTLQRTDKRLKELLKEENFPGAIQLSLEYQEAASTYGHYKCISELNSKLQDKLEMIDEALDVALSKTCQRFDNSYYSRIQQAYRLLGKTQVASDQLHMHYMSCIHNIAFNKVLGYVELCSGKGDGSFQKKQFTDLCQFIKSEVFMPCLIDLCKALWQVALCYKKTLDWHIKHDNEEPTPGASNHNNVTTTSATTTIQYIRNKLEVGKTRLWGEIQQKVKTYLLAIDLSHFKYDVFIRVLDVTNRLMKVGDEFCSSHSEGLNESMRKQSINYFRTYHQSRLEELRMFMHNEGWEVCPVKCGFNIFMLHEFKFFKISNTSTSNIPTNASFQIVPNLSYYCETGSPFDIQLDEDSNEDSQLLHNNHLQKDGTTSDSDDDVPDELKQQFVHEGTGDLPVPKSPVLPKINPLCPLITNTALTICRLFGRYMQMLYALQSISYDVIVCMTHLFNYYLISVEFTPKNVNDATADNIGSTSSTHQGTPVSTGHGASRSSTSSGRRARIELVHLSSLIRLDSADDLFGLRSRIVATESLIFMSEQFKALKPYLYEALPIEKKGFLEQYFLHTMNIVSDIRRPIYYPVVFDSLKLDVCLDMMVTQVRWDIKEIMSQHSTYVDAMLNEIKKFQLKLSEFSKSFPIPTPVNDCLWEQVSRVCNQTLVEGFSAAKKCTNEGRALMMLDYQQFLIKFEKFTTLRPIPGRDYVEGYIKAFYLPENQLETWIAERKEYTPKQLLSLVTCLGHISKKTKQKLLSSVDDTTNDKIKR